jgi:hypothetical protein
MDFRNTPGQTDIFALGCMLHDAIELAISHNRWHVMAQVGAMLGATADNGLVDRIIIEISLESNIEYKLRQIENTISWSRRQWHPEIAKYLTKKENDFVF